MLKRETGLLIGLGAGLGKFFTDTPVPRQKALRLSGLRGEVVSFQVIYSAPFVGEVAVHVSGRGSERLQARRIGLAHVEHPTYAAPASDRIGRAPGFYPDPLMPDAEYRAFPGQTRGIWFTYRIPERANAGRSRFTIRLKAKERKSTTWQPLGSVRVAIDVIGAALPKQRLKVIHWFHNDCLMSHYGFEAWSPEHWRMVAPYLRNAAEHGINTITTPVFTPPLDTAVGTERPTVQLVDVTVTGKDSYRFNFARLGKWMDLCRRCGMTGFEISHLFTQWGAKCAPKIVAKVKGRERRIFGWQTAAAGPRYRKFLLRFLPKLVAFLRSKRALGCSYLHVSDEPSVRDLAQYGACRGILRQGAPELPVVEALSNIEFYEHGHVDRPCPATDHAQPFLDRKVPHCWTYYCCGQTDRVSNRFMDFPSARNRILGWQLYKFGFEGFLQWGYNHWYDRLSDVLIDPYTNSHAGRPLPPGDGFVVYPGEEGPVDSIRWEIWREGIQDMRALCLLERLAGQEPSAEIKRLLALTPIRSMKVYPRSPDWILRTREGVNDAIARLLK